MWCVCVIVRLVSGGDDNVVIFIQNALLGRSVGGVVMDMEDRANGSSDDVSTFCMWYFRIHCRICL